MGIAATGVLAYTGNTMVAAICHPIFMILFFAYLKIMQHLKPSVSGFVMHSDWWKILAIGLIFMVAGVWASLHSLETVRADFKVTRLHMMWFGSLFFSLGLGTATAALLSRNYFRKKTKKTPLFNYPKR